jgi:transcriptional regulator
MRTKPKEPRVPVERHETLRRQITAMIEEYTLSAREIAHALRIPESEVYDHLEHIRRTIHKTGQEFEVTPAFCEHCGFTFKKRERLRKPGKCPLCHSSLIKPPLFALFLRDSKDKPSQDHSSGDPGEAGPGSLQEGV